MIKNNTGETAPISDSDLHTIEQGNLIDKLAKELFRETTFLEEQDICSENVFFQKGIEVEGLKTRSDILVKVDDGTYRLYEVKATTKVGTPYLLDIAFQVVAFEKAGFKISSTYLIHVNNEYEKNGDIDIQQLFIVADTTENVKELIPSVRENIKSALVFINGDEPLKRINHNCSKKTECPFFKMHFPDFPDYSVYDVSRIHKNKRIALLEKSIFAIKEIPDDFKLSEKQRLQVEIAKSGNVHIEKAAIKNILDGLEYPLYFLDYETFSYAIPSQDKIRPYQQMVFQYSLHVLNEKGGELTHFEYLLNKKDEPLLNLINHLKEAMPTDKGHVVVWNKSFEKSRNNDMLEMYPEFATFFNSINDRLFDLAEIFQKQLYVHPKFKGRYSIKKVLPVLAPEYDYSDMEIYNGQVATIKWHHLTDGRIEGEAATRLRQALLEYCKLDTLAMVKILESLIDI